MEGVRREKNKVEQRLGGSLTSRNHLNSRPSKVEKLKRFLCAACPFFKGNSLLRTSIIVEVVFAGCQLDTTMFTWPTKLQIGLNKLYSVVYTTYLGAKG